MKQRKYAVSLNFNGPGNTLGVSSLHKIVIKDPSMDNKIDSDRVISIALKRDASIKLIKKAYQLIGSCTLEI